DTFTINQPPQMLIGNGVDSITGNCAGDSTNLAPPVSGGTPPYTYSWSNGSIEASTLVLAGFYSLTVTDTNGCTGTYYANVEYPDPLGTITSSLAETSLGSCDGSASVTVTNGTAPYSFAWNTGDTSSSIGALC